MSENETTGPIGLHELSPAPGSRRPRKRIGRGTGSGTGKTSGRGQKGQKSRSGSHMMRAGFEGGQNPLYMLLGKQRGPHKKTSMPFGPFRTQTTGVNLRDIARRFESGADVTPEAMLAARVVRTLRHPVKVLGVGEVPGPLNVTRPRLLRLGTQEDRGRRRHRDGDRGARRGRDDRRRQGARRRGARGRRARRDDRGRGRPAGGRRGSR